MMHLDIDYSLGKPPPNNSFNPTRESMALKMLPGVGG